jgi:hypothetical protein
MREPLLKLVCCLQLVAVASSIVVRQSDLLKLEPDSSCPLSIAQSHSQLGTGSKRTGALDWVNSLIPCERLVEDLGGGPVVGICVAQERRILDGAPQP